jgi:hypothetical protein
MNLRSLEAFCLVGSGSSHCQTKGVLDKSRFISGPLTSSRPAVYNFSCRDANTRTSCPRVAVDPELLAVVDIHPESPVEEDKVLIRESVFRRPSD